MIVYFSNIKENKTLKTHAHMLHMPIRSAGKKSLMTQTQGSRKKISFGSLGLAHVGVCFGRVALSASSKRDVDTPYFRGSPTWRWAESVSVSLFPGYFVSLSGSRSLFRTWRLSSFFPGSLFLTQEFHAHETPSFGALKQFSKDWRNC